MESRLDDLLADFAGALTSATYAPDEYPMPEYVDYQSNMTDLRELWAKIRPHLRRESEKVNFVDSKLSEMFSAFDRGEKMKGRRAALAIYNLGVEDLR